MQTGTENQHPAGRSAPGSLRVLSDFNGQADSVTQADTGLGTAFERWALNRYLQNLAARTGISSAFEGPDDGMTGISGLNSLILGSRGVQVHLLLPHPGRASFARRVWEYHAPQAGLEIIQTWDGNRLPADDESADLAWNFNIMTRPADPCALLREMVRVSRKYVLVFVPNRSNYSFWLHRLHHQVAKEPWDHGRVDLMQPEAWRKQFEAAGLQPVEVVWLDCPWWPDIVDYGQLVADFLPPLKGLAHRARPENRILWQAEDLPYYRPQDFPQVQQQMERLAFFEKSRFPWLKQRFAHHVGVLGIKK